MIKILAVDDEPNNLELIGNLISGYCPAATLVATAHSVNTAFEAIQQHHPDLVLLDIQLQDGTGFDLLERIGKIDFQVIFITAYEEFAVRAFKFSAVDFVLKPVSPRDLIAAVNKAGQLIEKEDAYLKYNALLANVATGNGKEQYLVLKTQDKIFRIELDDIARFESDGSYTTAYLCNGEKVLVSRLIKEFEVLLAENGFIRIHQSHLINIKQFYCFDKNENHIILHNKDVVPVSTRKKEILLQLINKMG
ncbi:MAG TPA: LytTR family DNA-binding domain-containing protein [Flavobacteriales bacterium]|nr:LytTR family DNA-binding domain-containing protein [Flavobacteriales bacterium]